MDPDNNPLTLDNTGRCFDRAAIVLGRRDLKPRDTCFRGRDCDDGRCAVSSHVCLVRKGRRAAQAAGLRPVVAGIIGAGRSWTAWMISVFDAARVGGGDPKVGMTELSLDDHQRDPFAAHLHCVGVAELVWREPSPNAGRHSGVSQQGADPGGRARAATGGSAEHTEKRADQQPSADGEPRIELLPGAAVHSRPRDACRPCRGALARRRVFGRDRSPPRRAPH